MNTPMVEARGVHKSYAGIEVLKGVDLTVTRGEVTCLIGPSGSGKSTLLRCINHLEKHDAGELRVDGGLVGYEARGGKLYELNDKQICAERAQIGMVFQRFNLFQHLTVLENVTVGQVKVKGSSVEAANAKARELLTRVGLESKEKNYPSQLSGGQQQRVALARALAIEPAILLLDEPLSALDAQIRRSMVEEIARLHAELPDLTILYVTHDQSEALTLADRIAILKDGALSAVGRTGDLYRRPPNRFSAEFLGRANLLSVVVESDADASGFVAVRAGDERLVVPGADDRVGATRLLCVRPQNLTLAPDGAHSNRLVGTLREIHWQGELTHLVAQVGDALLRVVATRLPTIPARGERLEMFFAPADASLIAEDADV